MTVRTPEVRQREHEFWQAYRAAKRLEELLELARLDKRAAQRVRLDLAALLIELGAPMADFGA